MSEEIKVTGKLINCMPATRKDGTLIEGTNSQGKQWKVYNLMIEDQPGSKIKVSSFKDCSELNSKYIECTVEKEINGAFTNYKLKGELVESTGNPMTTGTNNATSEQVQQHFDSQKEKSSQEVNPQAVGLACHLAQRTLTGLGRDSEHENFFIEYKKLVKEFYKNNLEIQNELENTEIVM